MKNSKLYVSQIPQFHLLFNFMIHLYPQFLLAVLWLWLMYINYVGICIKLNFQTDISISMKII
jgi:hypothetical protein